MTDVSLRIKVDSAETDKGKKSLDDLAKAGAQAEASGKGLTQQTDRLSTAAKAAQAAFTALVGSMAVRKVIEYADEWQNAENRLKLVTSSSQELARVQGELLTVANGTRAGFASTAELYTTLTRSTTALGLSTDELLSITKTINQTFQVAGASAQGMEGAIRQLSQGLAAGALRGDEFNSVAEQAPGIMDALAASLKMTRGELREFAATGGISAEILVKALQDYAETAEKMAATATRTFGQSMTEARNNMLAFVGSSDAVKDATQGAGNVIVALSNNLEALGNVATVAAIAYGSKLAGAAATSAAAFISSTAAASAAMAAEVARTQALVVSTGAEAARTAALIVGNSAMFTSATAIAAAQAAQVAHTQAVAANASAVTAATAANWAWRASLLALFGPGAIIGIAAAAMYALVQLQKASADEADRQSVAFDKVRASLGKLTEGELARAMQAEFEHQQAIKASIKEVEDAIRVRKGSMVSVAMEEEELRKLNVQLDASTSNHALLRGQLDRVQAGFKPVTAETIELTQAMQDQRTSAAQLIQMMDNTEAAYVALMGVQVETHTRMTRLTAAQREGIEANQDAADSIDDLVEGMTAQEAASESMTRVTELMRDDISSAFADMMMSGENAFDAIAKSFERMVYKMVADWAASKIMDTVSGFLGMSGGGGGAGGGGSGAGSILSGAASKAAGKIFGGGTGGTGGTGGITSAGVKSGLMTAGAGIAGGYAGTKLGESLFDKQSQSNIGAGLGATAGGIIGGPIGAAIGGAIGGGLDALFGADGTMSSNAGLLLHDVPGAKADQKFAVPAFDSGFAPVGFARREDQGAAVAVIDTLRGYDSALTAIAESVGINVSLNNNTFRPMGSSETGRGDGVFVGLAAEDGKSKSASVQAQADEYVRLFVEGLGSQINPGAKSAILSAGSADAMLAKAAELVGINGSHANGLAYVPFDGYRAELHRGESVLTEQQTRTMAADSGRIGAELASMKASMMDIALYTKRTADVLLSVTQGGNSLITSPA